MVYIVTAIIVLAILAIFFVFVRKNTGQKQPSRWVFLAFFLVIAGIVFSENRIIGYGLMGTGVLLAVIDIILRNRNQGKTL